jgi:broad-specificity NMP kinase
MIVELFGPPGAGKTTFANALATQLRARGLHVELKLSWRPAERPLAFAANAEGSSRYRNTVVDRLIRPIREMLTIARHPVVNSRDIGIAVDLIRRLPPKNILLFVKNVQYLSRLAHAWRDNDRATHITVFDQAFVQAVYSLVMVTGPTTDMKIAEAVSHLPKSDLVVRVQAPLKSLKTRLHDRGQRQGKLENLFEADVKKTLASLSLIDYLENILMQQGRPALCISSLDQNSLKRSVGVIERKIVARLGSDILGAA